jgi:hypothetical protein
VLSVDMRRGATHSYISALSPPAPTVGISSSDNVRRTGRLLRLSVSASSKCPVSSGLDIVIERWCVTSPACGGGEANVFVHESAKRWTNIQ